MHVGDHQHGAVPGIHHRQRLHALILLLLAALLGAAVAAGVPLLDAQWRRSLFGDYRQPDPRPCHSRRLQRPNSTGFRLRREYFEKEAKVEGVIENVYLLAVAAVNGGAPSAAPASSPSAETESPSPANPSSGATTTPSISSAEGGSKTTPATGATAATSGGGSSDGFINNLLISSSAAVGFMFLFATF
ncbi:hypothetical protein ZIOFF_001379 [Zingiber officinale]|uniref:Uncharacterized protein n=1 Tax=Zingiber officinale TaxID=94328 RepID=A0A8J5M7H2_ZINOF|nr:hypothetical protein ZIOFF_001379 [Zingiber officinale]